MRFIDLTGHRFGRLTVIERAKRKSSETMWLCRCDCGNERIVNSSRLRSGRSQSCGCLKREKSSERLTTHGMYGTKLYQEWQSMKRRCYNQNCKDYPDYGGRGITMCEPWKNNFESFYKDVSILPHCGEAGYTLNRKNNNGNYEPGNVEWADDITQANNKRSNRLLPYNGQIKTMAQWSRELGIKYGTLQKRLKSGWTIEKALSTKAGQK